MSDGLIFILERFGGEDVTPIEALLDALDAVGAAAHEQLTAAIEAAEDARGIDPLEEPLFEEPRPEWTPPLLPDGRPLVALRLARDPGTGRFTLHFVAGPAEAAG